MATKREFVDLPADIAARLETIRKTLPETTVRTMSTGRPLWRIRGNTFAWLASEVRGDRTITTVTFRAEGLELDALLHVGHPFYAGWGGGLIALVLDDDTDWDEVAELLGDSYCMCAPKKLARRVNGDDTPPQ